MNTFTLVHSCILQSLFLIVIFLRRQWSRTPAAPGRRSRPPVGPARWRRRTSALSTDTTPSEPGADHPRECTWNRPTSWPCRPPTMPEFCPYVSSTHTWCRSRDRRVFTRERYKMSSSHHTRRSVAVEVLLTPLDSERGKNRAINILPVVDTFWNGLSLEKYSDADSLKGQKSKLPSYLHVMFQTEAAAAASCGTWVRKI